MRRCFSCRGFSITPAEAKQARAMRLQNPLPPQGGIRAVPCRHPSATQENSRPRFHITADIPAQANSDALNDDGADALRVHQVWKELGGGSGSPTARSAKGADSKDRTALIFATLANRGFRSCSDQRK